MNDAFETLVMRLAASGARVLMHGCGSAEPCPSMPLLTSSSSAKPTVSPTFGKFR